MSLPPELESSILRNLLAQTTRAYEEQMAALEREKELALVTLASIGDGVITTDAEARITYLNPVAEKLTGWSAAEALAEPLERVFLLVDEATGKPAPIDLADAMGRPVALEIEGRRMLLRRDGQRFAVEHTAAPIQSPDGSRAMGAVIVFHDVTDRRLLALQLAHQATHDALTGLINRQAFETQLRSAIDTAQRFRQRHCLCYMDLDQFKLVNDTCGHLAGDELLRRVTALIQDEVRETDVVARLGGDEFGVLLPRCPLEPARRIAHRIHEAISSYRFTWQEKTFAVGVSIGLVPIAASTRGLAQLLSAADHACYMAKDKGRNRIQVYQADDAEVLRRADEMHWVVRLQETLEADRFRLYAQEIRPLSTALSEASGTGPLIFEVLVRMIDRDGRVLAPGSFIRAAERYGLMPSIDRWVLSHLLDRLEAELPALTERIDTCTVNLSAVSVSDESFLEFAKGELARRSLPPSMICFEITETAVVANLAQAERMIDELGRLGCRFALDDFGSGSSSYSKLRRLAVSFLKIDRIFIRDLVTNPLDRAMVDSINQMAHAHGIRTVAEGASNRALVERLVELGVDYVQGYWLGTPRPLEELLAECLERPRASREAG